MNIFEINFNILQASSLVTVQIEKPNQPKILFQNKLIMFQFKIDLHLAFIGISGGRLLVHLWLINNNCENVELKVETIKV